MEAGCVDSPADMSFMPHAGKMHRGMLPTSSHRCSPHAPTAVGQGPSSPFGNTLTSQESRRPLARDNFEHQTCWSSMHPSTASAPDRMTAVATAHPSLQELPEAAVANHPGAAAEEQVYPSLLKACEASSSNGLVTMPTTGRKEVVHSMSRQGFQTAGSPSSWTQDRLGTLVVTSGARQ